MSSSLESILFVITLDMPGRAAMVMGTIEANSYQDAQIAVMDILEEAGVRRSDIGQQVTDYGTLHCNGITLHISPLKPFKGQWANLTASLIECITTPKVARRKPR